MINFIFCVVLSVVVGLASGVLVGLAINGGFKN